VIRTDEGEEQVIFAETDKFVAVRASDGAIVWKSESTHLENLHDRGIPAIGQRVMYQYSAGVLWGVELNGELAGTSWPSIQRNGANSANFYTDCVFGACDTPPPDTTPSAQWERIFFDGFENGFEEFNSGGMEASINFKKKYEGLACLRIKDGKSSSRAYTGEYDVSQYSELKVSFFYRSGGVEDNEGFALEYVAYGGYWVVAEDFYKSLDWEDNSIWKEASVEFSASTMDTVQLQFRGDKMDRRDKSFIDNVLFEGK
jgi:hypothetical protein